MQIPDNNPNQSNFSNGPPAGPAFVRKRKTHLNDTVIAVLRSLPRAARLDQNKLITSRNQQRAVGRAYRESDPSRNETGERYSSDESLCSISDNDEDTAGSSRLDGLPLGDLSPNSLRALASKLLKRKKDADESDDDTDSAITKAKKQMTNRKAEVVIKAGESFMPGFNDLHYALSYNNCYIPLSLFTNANLAVINREALTLPKTSINPHATKGKKSYLLDIEKFESKYGSEAKLTQLEWVEGASNFVGFLESFGDSGTAQVTRWKNHFGFFESRPDAINIFPAIRALDIRFRKDYISKPFAFDTSLYDSELQKTITQTELERMREESRIELQNMRDHFSNKDPSCGNQITLPFKDAPAATLQLPCASSAPRRATSSVPATRLPSTMAPLPLAKPMDLTSSPPKGNPTFAAAGTSEESPLPLVPTTLRTSASTSVPFAATSPTTLSHGLADVTPPGRYNRVNKPFVDVLSSVFSRPSPPHRLASHDSIFSKIVTPYNPDAFDSLLNKHKLSDNYPLLVRNLRNGFPLGEFPNLPNHIIFPIHNTALPYIIQIDAYLAEEVESGRMSGPFNLDETTLILKGPFQCSPIVVDVQDGKLRICRHLSKESKSSASVNSFIDAEKFPTCFGSAAEVAEIIANAPPGTQAMMLDIAKFHRTCPIIPDHKLWFVVRGSLGFYIDHTCPFGCSSASSNSGMIANAAMDIWEAEGVKPIVKYEDDVNVFRFPTSGGLNPDGSFTPFAYPYDRASAVKRIESLNIPWHPDKGQDFDDIFKYIGFLWCISGSTHPCRIDDVMRIHGSL
ncbi:hypothetical protein AX14_008258 [Amanita brunnescens Koide BX004]|nr:hypothetical protein AX14_008258 [Amanita brunnescens Koide BX004]